VERGVFGFSFQSFGEQYLTPSTSSLGIISKNDKEEADRKKRKEQERKRKSNEHKANTTAEALILYVVFKTLNSELIL